MHAPEHDYPLPFPADLRILDVPLEPLVAATPFADAAAGRMGALVEFTGIVRGTEDGAPIRGLRYEAYAPMALREMRRLLHEIAADTPLLGARAWHRTGDIHVGEAAIHLCLGAAHRAAAFAAAMRFMDRLKEDVPIWKTEVLR